MKAHFQTACFYGGISLFEKSTKPDISVIVPTYNEDKNIGEVLRRLRKIDWPNDKMEIIVVDDGSRDNTSKEVADFTFVKYIRHEINQGKGAALRTGIKNSSGKVIVIQDADMEYLPEHIPHLVKPILAGTADIVYGSRFNGRYDGMSLSHFIGNRVLSLVAGMLYNVPITDIMTGHKAFNRQVFDSFELEENGFAVEVEMTSKSLLTGWRYTEVSVPYSYRNNGFSKIVYLDGVKSLIRLVMDRARGMHR